MIGRDRREARRIARNIVREYGWWTLQWPMIRRHFPRHVRWAANAAVVVAVVRGVREACR